MIERMRNGRYVGEALRAAAIVAGICAATAATASGDGTAVDWKKAAIDDIAAANRSLLDNDPGAVPGVDPKFLTDIDHATDLANSDAQSVDSYEGYRASLQRFANVFQDNHLSVQFKAAPHLRWPGFLLGYKDHSFAVVSTLEANIPLGAGLIGCDELSAETMATRSLAAYAGNWTAPSARRRLAPYLLLDSGNPFVPRPASCAFAQNGRTWSVALQWRDTEQPAIGPQISAAQQIAPQSSGGVRATQGGGYWVGIPTLNAMNPAAIAGLESLMKQIEDKAPAIRTAKYFVIDLRGNGGGNTFVALRALNAIWGAGALAGVRPKNLQAQWRASAGTAAYLKSVLPLIRQMFEKQSIAYSGLSKVVQGFDQAIAKGQALYVDDDEYSILDADKNSPRYNVSARAFVLTDGACQSSCLNLMDLILKLPNVVQIGEETGSDTNYLENRPVPLPSGFAMLQFPTKLYRNRARGANEAYEPAYSWNGDITDTAKLEQWVAGLGM